MLQKNTDLLGLVFRKMQTSFLEYADSFKGCTALLNPLFWLLVYENIYVVIHENQWVEMRQWRALYSHRFDPTDLLFHEQTHLFMEAVWVWTKADAFSETDLLFHEQKHLFMEAVWMWTKADAFSEMEGTVGAKFWIYINSKFSLIS